MSTYPQPPVREVTPSWVKWLIGCTAGCLLVGLLACGGMFAVGYHFTKPLVEQGQRAQAAQQDAVGAMAAVRAVEAKHPAKLAEAGVADLTDDDVSRYLRIRKDVDPHLRRTADLIASVKLPTPEALERATGPRDFMGPMSDMLKALADLQEMHASLLRETAAVLEREQVGPADFARMAEIVDWRFLQRPEAMALGLEEFRRDDVARAQMEVRFAAARLEDSRRPMPRPRPAGATGSTPEQIEQELAAAQKKLDELTGEARAEMSLTAATRAALEAHRAELEALDTVPIAMIAPLTEKPAILRALDDASHHGNARWDGPSGTSTEIHVSAEAPDVGASGVEIAPASGDAAATGESAPSGP